MSAVPHHQFATPPGGVMTAGPEGAISGDLILRVRVDGDRAFVEVAYAETDAWYLVDGGEVALDVALHPDAAAIVADVLAADLGIDADGNPLPSDLTRIEPHNLARWPTAP